MDDEDNDYELERQKTIAENRELLDSLGLDPSGASKIPGAQPKLAKPKTKPAGVKRKAPAVKADEGPRRRSGRLAGIEATAEEIQKREEAEEVEREIIRVVNRKIRDQVMDLDKMVEDSSPNTAEELDPYLKHMSCLENPKVAPKEDSTDMDDYTDKETLPAEVQRLKAAFKGMTLRANAKVTSERVFSMVVHPEKTKTLVFAGDKNGMLGIWDALGQSDEKVKNEDDTSGAAVDDGEEEEGKIWHVQAHARSSITAMKIDPVSGSGLYSSSYDCSLRHIDFATLNSRELFSLPDEDMLITHFDLTPNGNEAWIADKNGGISHCDFREPGKRRGEDKESRRRWVVQEEGRAAKLGGISVNPAMPHLVLTAGNDQHLRIWDTRHLTAMTPKAAEYLSSEPEKSNGVKSENDPLDLNGESVTAPHVNTHPSSSIPYESIDQHTKSAKNKDKGLLRASYQHGKSCSAAYWDPRGRRILTTSYDDKLRIWDVKPNSLAKEAVLAPTHFQPYVKIPHNCQTGRWLTILRAQWSLNMDFMPHFTVGNMKRTLDVVAATGDKIVSLWTDGVSAVPAVTASHPNRVDHVLGGNTSGRVQLWTASP